MNWPHQIWGAAAKTMGQGSAQYRRFRRSLSFFSAVVLASLLLGHGLFGSVPLDPPGDLSTHRAGDGPVARPVDMAEQGVLFVADALGCQEQGALPPCETWQWDLAGLEDEFDVLHVDYDPDERQATFLLQARHSYSMCAAWATFVDPEGVVLHARPLQPAILMFRKTGEQNQVFLMFGDNGGLPDRTARIVIGNEP